MDSAAYAYDTANEMDSFALLVSHVGTIETSPCSETNNQSGVGEEGGKIKKLFVENGIRQFMGNQNSS